LRVRSAGRDGLAADDLLQRCGPAIRLLDLVARNALAISRISVVRMLRSLRIVSIMASNWTLSWAAA
jgi:hypothetical protein